jgi:hypothetical protein
VAAPGPARATLLLSLALVLVWAAARVPAAPSGTEAAAGLPDWSLSIGALAGHRWISAQSLGVSLETDSNNVLNLQLRAAQVDIAGLILRDLTLDCPLAGTRIECRAGRLRLKLADDTAITARVSLQLGPAGLALSAQANSGGANPWRIQLQTAGDDRWTVQVKARDVDLARLHALVPEPWLASLPAGRWPGALAGSATLDGSIEGDAEGLGELAAQLDLRRLGFDATDAAEQAGVSLALALKRLQSGWSFHLDARHDEGLLYLVPGIVVGGGLPGLLLDTAAEGIVQVTTDARWSPADAQIDITKFELAQGADLRLAASARLRAGEAEELRLSLPPAPVARLYRNWLQPFLAGSLLDRLEGEGRLGLALHQVGTRSELAIDFERVTLADAGGRLSVHGLHGRLALGGAHAGSRQQLAVERLTVQGLPLGPLSLPLTATDDGLRLSEAAELPLLDGRVLLDELAFSQAAAGGEDSLLRFAGVLTPVSLPALCTALGLPRAAGEVSGVLPEVRWSASRIGVDGDLLLRLFDGQIVARNLVVLEPFGTLPELDADLDVTGIDLDLLTRESGFGRVRGSLEGHVHGLRMQAWQPVAMDLFLATPENDPRPNRISQRAVGSLSALSGGGPGVLSSGLMRFFSDYSYGRLGVGCRLVDGRCEVRGVESSQDGGVVLLSRGGLLPPWIEVRASSRDLSWNSLMEIYSRIASGELVVQ